MAFKWWSLIDSGVEFLKKVWFKNDILVDHLIKVQELDLDWPFMATGHFQSNHTFKIVCLDSFQCWYVFSITAVNYIEQFNNV